MNWNITNTSGQAITKTYDLLQTLVSSQTVIYLSGGNTPKPLYELFAVEKRFHPGAVGMVDERYGPKWQEKSNELMMKESGLLEYLKNEDVSFYSILTGRDIEETTEEYDQTIRQLHAQYTKHVCVLGIGSDGHIAGIPANESAYIEDGYALVTNYVGKKMGERITLTKRGLSLMDEIIVLVLGEEKKKALELMKKEGSEEEIPARFLMRDTISPKVTIITDQTL
jgi:6-phosphogluconolactonase/glucosamine-6-phosphate isomerase/deaminase